MKGILIIFKKEFLGIMRDKRTVILMVVLPLLIFPLLMGLVTKISVSQNQKAKERVLKVGLITNGNAAGFLPLIKERKDMTVDQSVKAEDIQGLIKQSKKDFILEFAEDFDAKTAAKNSGSVTIHYRSSNENDIGKRRIREVLRTFEDQLLEVRLQAMSLDKAFVDPVAVTEKDIATVKEQIGRRIGGLLPYFFILFCFLGAMYPAIDLGAGEKEHSTLETLLTTPANRMQIVTGKFMVITLAGLISAVISIVGMSLAVKMAVKIPAYILDALLKIIAPSSIALVLSLLVPLTVFFAAILLSMSIYAKTFKEAQTIMTPMNFFVIIPAVLGTLPGMKLNAVTALIPVLNVTLATKDIISGTIEFGTLMLVYLSLFVFAGVSLYLCSRLFNREDVIFRGI